MPVQIQGPETEAARRSKRLVYLAFGLGLLLVVAWFLRHALLLLYISAIFGVVLTPAVDRIHGTKIFGRRPSRGVSVLILLLGALAVIGVVAGFAIPALVSDIGDFATQIPSHIEKLEKRVHSIPLLRNFDFGRLGPQVLSAIGGIAPALGGAGRALMDFLTVVLLAAYLILDGERLFKALLSTVAPESRGRLEATLVRTGRRMRGWLVGQAILMLILGGSAMVTFGFMGLPYFYLLGVFAGIANIIPMLGPALTVILAGIVAATVSGWKVVGVGVFYLIYQQVEDAFLTPHIMKTQVSLSSSTVLIALLIGGELAGIAGALVAVPSAVLVVEIAGEYLSKDPRPE